MDILSKLREKLKEEQWTRSTIENYSPKELKILEELVNEIIREHKETEAHDICSEFVGNSPKSITGLYILGILSYEIEDKKNTESITQVVEIFKENKKWNIVENLLNTILEYEESVYALKMLMVIYDNFKKETEKIEVLKRLVKVDTDNGDVAKRLAEYYEAHNNPDSVKYYKSALRRYAKNKQFSLVESIWKKIAPPLHEEINFFLNIGLLLSESNLDLSINLLTNLLEILENESKIEEAIFVAKNILSLDDNNQKIKNKLIDLYRLKYMNNNQLEECIKNSGLLDSKLKVEQAIKKFEKEILFDEGSYVYHKIWGIGKLVKMVGEDFLLNFDNKVEHKMSYSMALKSLIPLNPDHIWVLKKEKKLENKEDTESMRKILLTILKSFPDKALSIDNFKEELVPDIVQSKSWNTWWNKAKNVLKQETSIGTVKDGRPKYILRDIKIKFEEELINSFFQSKKFEERLKIFEEFTKDSDSLEEFSDFFREMIAYFTEIIQSTTRYDFHEKLLSYILIRKIKKTFSWAINEVPGEINMFMDKDKLIELLNQNYRADYKKDIIILIDKYHPESINILEEVLWNDRGQLAGYVLEKIDKHLKNNEIKDLVDQALNNRFKTNPYITIWFLQFLLADHKYQELNFNLKEIYIEILYRIDTLGKLINQKKLNWFTPTLPTPDAKKILNNANDNLFKNDEFKDYILNNDDKDYVIKIYHLIKSSNGLNPKHKNELIKFILKKYPDIEEIKTDEDYISYVTVNYYDSKYIWSSQQGLDKQIKKLVELKKEKELNLVDLEKAREKGDLRENAEYQYAKEKDTNLNNQITQLHKLVSQVKLIDLTHINGEEITPGTTFTMDRNGKNEKFSILGYWDTDETKHIIAYDSPLAKEVMGAKKGEERDVELGGEKIKIKILDIQVFKF